ncbi:MAG TPA: lipocalin-like domain-containing protein [Steroidobacteraceae bacterium]|nr:lipocalin-like domain-containing protein [Steroidobacteraceae bacterium]
MRRPIARRTAAAATLALLVGLTVIGPDARPGTVVSVRRHTPDANYAANTRYAKVEPGHPVRFPADFGSHPAYRIEWWYLTGWLKTRRGAPLGVQITFFRNRPDIWRGNPSAFTPRQLLIAHCALADPQHGRLWRAQRIERAGFGLAGAGIGDTDVWVGRWRLVRNGGVYRGRCAGRDFSVDLSFTATQPPLLNGVDGYSRKSADPRSASEYYSIPQLRVAGRITRDGRAEPVTGAAWLDHEWSSAYLARGAVGWDWIGINLEDGGALMAFRIRGKNGLTRWAGGTVRSADGRVQILSPADVRFTPLRQWVSPRTAIRYPIEWRVRAGRRILRLRPLLDDQENDARASSGTIYWEGAVRAFDEHRLVGHGYLELTGYGTPLRLR